MAVPKKKSSKGQTGARHAAYQNRRLRDLMGRANVVDCRECGAPTLSHTVCNKCGSYRGQKFINNKSTAETTRIQA